MRFEWPWMLAGLLLVPALVGLYVMAQKRRRKYTVRFTNLELLASVVGADPGWRRHVPPALYLLGTALLLISMARPTAVVTVPREQAAVVLVMDVSGSMKADDMPPDRMTAARRAAWAFIDTVPEQTQLGLVAFHTSASVRVPLTRDRALVERGVDALFAGGATAVGDGLAAALDQLALRPADQDGEQGPALVVLMSDGESNRGLPPLEAAERAQAEGVSVFTVGIGRRGATTIVNNEPVKLDELTLRAIAEATDGKYFYAEGSSELADIYSSLGSQLAWVEEKTEVTALVAGMAMLAFLSGGFLGLRWFNQIP